LPWFRFFRRRSDTAPVEAAAPAATDYVEVDDRPADTAGDQQQQKRRRRRGSRGGRGRRKPSERRTEAKAEPEPAPAREDTGPERREGKRGRRRAQPPRRARPKAKRELLVSVDVGEQRVAVLEDGKVAEVYLERPERRSIAGNIYKGRVENVLPGMEASFIEIGLEKNGFLYVDEIVTPELEGRRRDRKITDLVSRGQEVLVQAVKDPMKSKGARLTTEISLPGRFLVYVPSGEGLGVSRRLEDTERARLRDILKGIELPKGGIIVRTAAEGASAEDIEADLLFLTRLWRAIQHRAKEMAAPNLVYQEAELPLRVVRDLFTEDFERAIVDHERTHRRIVGYLKKTSPHMVERVERYRDKEPLMEAYGVEAEIRSTLSRRVDLPSGGYLVFDYAEAFTVIDVNTGRFTGSRSKNSSQRLEDTITKNNLEAVKEVVRQLRLRDIGGIIVIDFIDMANPKNRTQVQDALQAELERDRTKTYVVEISPLGLVEMTRQNVTDGPREILAQKCPTCAGDGIVVSTESAAIEVERRLGEIAKGSRVQAFQVEVSAPVADALVGPSGERLAAIEAQARRRFVLEPREDVAVDHFDVLRRGKRADLVPEAPFAEGDQLDVQLLEIGKRDPAAGVGKLDGFEISVADAARLVGKKAKVRLDRVVAGVGYATLVRPKPKASAPAPLTAEIQAEKPTRQPSRKQAEPKQVAAEAQPAPEEAPARESAEAVTEAPEAGEAEKPKKRTRRGSRGGRGRKKKQPQAESATASADGAQPERGPSKRQSAPKIHVPGTDLTERAAAGTDGRKQPAAEVAQDAESSDGEAAARPKKRTRRGSRGGRRRRKPAATPASADPPE
jgi:ribonuclease G